MGSTSTKQRKKNDIELNPLRKTARSKSVTENQDDFEECILVWLGTTEKYSDEYQEELDGAREIINNLHVFNNLMDCVNFLKMIVHDKVFLLVSQ